MSTIQRRLGLVFGLVLAIAAVTATSASAVVQVRNDEGLLCGQEAFCEVSGGAWLAVGANAAPGSLTLYSCQNIEISMELRGGENSYFAVNNFEVPFEAGCIFFGYPLNDCDDNGWAGQLLGPGDEGYVPYSGPEPPPGVTVEQFNLLIDSCLTLAQVGDQSGQVRVDVVVESSEGESETTYTLPKQNFGKNNQLWQEGIFGVDGLTFETVE